MKTYKILFLALAFSILPTGISFAQSQGQQQTDVSSITSIADPAARIAAYKTALAKGDYKVAKAFVSDSAAISVDIAQNRAVLKAQADSIVDLYSLMNKDWKIEQHNILCKALTERIGKGKVLSLSGVGHQPEMLIPWLKKNIPALYNDTDEGKQRLYVVNQAIRNWETIFKQATSRGYEWDGAPLVATKEEWQEMQLLDRNATLKKIAMHLARLGDHSLLAYDENIVETLTIQRDQYNSINQALQSNILTDKQKKEIMEANSISDKAYLLNKYFDGSNIKQDDPMRLAINANRQSYPDENFNAESRALMGSMLQTAISNEIKGTAAGKDIAAGLKIKIEYCDSSYSKVDENNPDTIIPDEETIQQYMRLKGYTAASVMKDKEQLAEIARYMSPAVVYEAAHSRQQKWADKGNTYRTASQEDEIDAMSQQALYMTEKMRNDPSFRSTFSSVEGYSKYAAKQVQSASAYTQGKKIFADNVRTSNQNLPTIASYTSNLINAIDTELARREALSSEDRLEQVQSETFNYNDDIVGKTPGEIIADIRYYEEGALARLHSELIKNSYAEYNKSSIADARKSYNAMMSSDTKPGSAARSVPLP